MWGPLKLCPTTINPKRVLREESVKEEKGIKKKKKNHEIMYNFFLEWRVCLLLPGEKGGKKREGKKI